VDSLRSPVLTFGRLVVGNAAEVSLGQVSESSRQVGDKSWTGL